MVPRMWGGACFMGRLQRRRYCATQGRAAQTGAGRGRGRGGRADPTIVARENQKKSSDKRQVGQCS